MKPISTHLLIGAISLVYAFVRYVIFGAVSPEHIPLYLLNKSTAIAGVIYFFLFAYHQWRNPPLKTGFRRVSFNLVTIHVLMSLVLISPERYPKLYSASGLLNLTGELSLATSIIAYTLWIKFRSIPVEGDTVKPLATPYSKLTALCAILIGVHLITMGFKSWMDISSWNGNLPPITLIGIVFTFAALYFLIKKTKSPKGP